MIEQDTVKLLRECDAGAKMGAQSIDDVLPYVRADDLRNTLFECKNGHTRLSAEIQEELNRFDDLGKDPNPIAEKMSWLKTTGKLKREESDHTVADLMTDGCNMGVKSLNRYLNQYGAASEKAKDIAKKLIHMEDTLANGLRAYL